MIVSGLLGNRELLLDLGAEDYSYEIEDTLLNIEFNITTTTEISPVLGLYSEVNQTGWLYDKTLVVDNNTPSTLYGTYTGGNSFLLKDGTLQDDWTSGSIEETNLEINKEYKPVIDCFDFSIHSNIRRLYSDFSVSSLFSSSEINLEANADVDTIEIASYRRNSSLLNIQHQLWNYVESFSGTYNKEYTINDSLITLSEIPLVQHGFEFPLATYDLVTQYCVFLGRGTSAPKDFFTEYFPIIPSSVIAYVVYDDKTVERWSFVDDFSFSVDEDAVLCINKDLGVISCGGREYVSLVTSSDIMETDIEISFYTPKDIKDYPLKGIIKIGDEIIAFTDRTNNTLKGLIRGYDSTSKSSYPKGSLINFSRKGYPITEDASLYISYQSTARVDYEITSFSYRTSEIDIRPSSQPEASQIVQISSRLSDLDSIVLESDKASLGNNRYGPIYFGNDISRLTATAYDSNGNEVDNLEMTIEILDSQIGFLDGESKEVTKISNSDGKIFAYYNTPIDQDDFSTKLDSVTYTSGLSTFQVSNIDQFTSLDEVFLFQLFKHDPTEGTVGEIFLPATTSIPPYWGSSTKPGAAAYVEVIGTPSQNFTGGIIYILESTNILYTRTIVQIDKSIIYFDEMIPGPDIEKVFLLRPGDAEWDEILLNGLPVIVYEYTDNAIHPITGNVGAYSPIKPISITGTTVSYTQILPEPKPSDINSNLGGYMIINPITVGFRAYATDPYSGEIIYSNTIYLTVKLPNYLVGVDNTGSLPVPKGFNFIIDEENYGTGIGGANFYTINKSGGLFGLQLRIKK